MKLSETTVATLKSFAGIEDRLLIKAGTKQSTITEEETVMAEANLKDSFPQEFAIYDLHNFLATYATLNDPDLSFFENYLIMKDAGTSVKYYYCNPQLIKVRPPEEMSDIDNPLVSFVFTQDMYQKINKLTGLNDFTHLLIVGENGRLLIKLYNDQNDLANTVEISLNENYTGKDVKALIKLANLLIVPADYDVMIGDGFALFSTKVLRYFITLEEIED